MTKLEIGQENVPPDEEEATREIAQISERLIDKHPPVKRGEHPKAHGCVRGEFIIDPNLPNDDKIRVGIFKEPGKRFPACIRFSNFSEQKDTKGDAHGMAVKLMGVPGDKVLEDEKYEETQDFLLIDHPLFVVRNAKDYIEFFAEIERSGSRNPIKFFITGLNPFKWRWREIQIGLRIRLSKIRSPLESQYWSTTPYKYGSGAIKFSLKPSPDNISTSSKSIPKTENYLRDAIREHLNNKEACFDFLIQFQTDADKMPIEDPTIDWKSPYQKVATLKIPAQTFESPEQIKFCEDLSYTPWHSLPEHRPLGGINRPRKQVYELISRLRNRLNNVPHKEPTTEEFFSIFPLDVLPK
ncbi:MAG: catalase family protein [Moorea sp. SIO1F2]|uniref:catalase family protein n=1 Tax=Moorena sp. SIO1F2 TaxID=2607819 RepID=UPI0013BDB0EE|nr:catalase family protein [Moorena sp. SIO1F2]NET84574.1 catalase family protein [Moorena sp. SIO1F2]